MKDQALIETMKHLIVTEKISKEAPFKELVRMFVTDKMHISIESNLFAWEWDYFTKYSCLSKM